ncbi:MAG: ABC transporter ATP-binding protein [Rhodospirillaceae bacterium]|nr:MAG: ABC transporter ATP-binding protein [Rhodospirillaceae bacterium]
MSSDAKSPDIAIRVRDLSKVYLNYQNPRDRLLQSLLRHRRTFYREFWALRDISLEVERGEVVGILGRNGAGKSTLLQAICGTVTATSGTVEVFGRVAALLELGAGFNPEFSGRENVLVSATIMGMSPAEAAQRFDAIVAFAELADFIDQPVKTYSSGMYVRLAFAVAVHVDPEILIVDEALSVGDLAFRNKCLDKIHEMVARGITVLFVTHDISTLQLLCNRVVWLDHGRVRMMGDPIKVSQDYYAELMGGGRKVQESGVAPFPVQQMTGKAILTDVQLLGGADNTFSPGQTLTITFSLLAKLDLGPVVFTISIYRSDGDWLVGQTSRETGVYWDAMRAGETRKGRLELAPLCLAPGEYMVAMGACSEDYTLTYALTDLSYRFAVRAPYPTWGKFIHPARWIVE